MIVPPVVCVVWYWRAIEVAAPRLRRADRRGTHRARDAGGLVRDVLAHAAVVVVEVEGHAQQRQAVGVAVGRIEVEVVLACG